MQRITRDLILVWKWVGIFAILQLCSPLMSSGQQKPPTVTAAPKPATVSTVPEMVQSPYYDAIELMYILYHKSKAFPVIVGKNQVSVTVQVSKSAPADPGQKAPPNGPVPPPNSGNQSAPHVPTASNPPPTGANTPQKSDTTLQQNVESYMVIEAETGKVLFGPSSDTAGVRKIIIANSNIADSTADSLEVDIMRRNIPNGGAMSPQELLDSVQTNLYFKAPAAAVAPSIDLLSATSTSPSQPNVCGGLPSLGTTGILQGVAQFLINRVNKEFENSFIDLLVSYLKEKRPEAGILFPKTLQSLEAFQLSNYKSSFTAIQNACQSDISSLPGHVSGLTALPWCQDLMKKYPPLVLLFTACDVSDMLQQNLTFQEILYRAGKVAYLDYDTSGLYSPTIRLLSLVSNSIRDIQFRSPNKDKAGWVDTSRISYLLQNQTLYRTFLGLIAENGIGIRFKGSTSFDFYHELMQSGVETALNTDKSLIYTLMQEVGNGKSAIATFTATLGSKPQLYNYLSAFGGIAAYMVDLAHTGIDLFPTTNKTKQVSKLLGQVKTTYLPMIGDLDSISYEIAQKQYSAALNEGIRLFDTIVAKVKSADSVAAVASVAHVVDSAQKMKASYAKANDSLTNASALLKQKGDSAGAAQLDALAKIAVSAGAAADSVAKHAQPPKKIADPGVSTLQAFVNFMNHLGQFIGAIAEAQSSKDVSDAIDAFALPPGSSKDMKVNGVSLGINAYVNVYHSWNRQYPGTNIPATEWGISAPIGLTLSTGLCHGKGGALSFFAGIVDVGAIFTYESTDTGTLKSTIQLGQIFSPSLSLIYDLPLFGPKRFNVPIEIGGGLQWGPKLKTVSQVGNSTLPFLTLRYNFFLGFDLPILHILGHERSHD
jgi:hypothetical protein